MSKMQKILIAIILVCAAISAFAQPAIKSDTAGNVWFGGNATISDSLMFGDEDTYITESADDTLNLYVGSVNTLVFADDTTHSLMTFEFDRSAVFNKGMVDLNSTALTIGDGTADTDYIAIRVLANTNSGQMRFYEDEDIWDFTEPIVSSTAIGVDSLLMYANCETVADDGTIDLPAQAGRIEVWVTDGTTAEWVYAHVSSDGSVTAIDVSTNGAVTDSDTDLCVYDAGSNAAIKNRLGSQLKLCYEFKTYK